MANLSQARQLKHILLIGVCSITLGANSALCIGQSRGPSSVQNLRGDANLAFGRDAHHQLIPAQTQDELQTRQSIVNPNYSRGTSDFNSLDTQRDSNAMMVPTGVYHSVIDRTGEPARLQSSSSMQNPAATTGDDLNTAAGHHHGHAHGKYYEYRSVPKKKTWKFGYKRGNHKHTISRHEHGKAGKHPHFKTKVKWHDSKSKGKGIHLWDYNHHDKKHYHHG